MNKDSLKYKLEFCAEFPNCINIFTNRDNKKYLEHHCSKCNPLFDSLAENIIYILIKGKEGNTDWAQVKKYYSFLEDKCIGYMPVISYAILEGNLEMVKWCIEQGFDINQDYAWRKGRLLAWVLYTIWQDGYYTDASTEYQKKIKEIIDYLFTLTTKKALSDGDATYEVEYIVDCVLYQDMEETQHWQKEIERIKNE